MPLRLLQHPPRHQRRVPVMHHWRQDVEGLHQLYRNRQPTRNQPGVGQSHFRKLGSIHSDPSRETITLEYISRAHCLGSTVGSRFTAAMLSPAVPPVQSAKIHGPALPRRQRRSPSAFATGSALVSQPRPSPAPSSSNSHAESRSMVLPHSTRPTPPRRQAIPKRSEARTVTDPGLRAPGATMSPARSLVPVDTVATASPPRHRQGPDTGNATCGAS